jgi:hypothetical protein
MTRVGSAELERRRSVIERWRRSGQSAAVYSKRHGMSQWTLFAWAKKCESRSERPRRARGAAPSDGRQRARGSSRAKPKREVDLVPVRLLAHGEASTAEHAAGVDSGFIEIQLLRGEVIRVLGEVSIERVRSVVAAVRQAC